MKYTLTAAAFLLVAMLVFARADERSEPITIRRATAMQFKSMLLVASGDGSTREFIGFSGQRAYCEAKDSHGVVTVYWIPESELDARFLSDQKDELRRRYERHGNRNPLPQPTTSAAEKP